MHKSAHSPSFNATFLTPVKLCKCLLICYYVQNENLKSKNSSTRDLLYKLGIYLVNQIQDNTECENEYTWEDIENQISESFKEYSSTITTWLISKLRQITSPDNLFDIFQQFEETLEANFDMDYVNISIFSVYLRMMVLTFEKMLFPGISRLFSQLQLFIPQEVDSDEEEEESIDEEDYKSWRQIEEKWFPSLISMRERCTSSLPYGALSPLEVEQYVASEAKKIQKLLLEGKETREELRSRINQLESMSPNVGAIHYLSYLCDIEQKDVLHSIDELHRYYDYQIYQYTSSVEAFKNSTATIPASLTSLQDHSLRNLLPYASLHLASLHFTFQNYREGFQCIKEAIRMSQGCSDSKGLTNALSCLYNFIRKSPQTSAPGSISSLSSSTSSSRVYQNINSIVNSDISTFVELLEKCISKAEELGLAHLASTNSLALVELLSHSPPTPLKWKLLMKSDEFNVRNNLLDMYTKNNLMRSTCWYNFGHKDLASFYTHLPLLLNRNNNTVEDFCTSYCKSAYQHWESGSFEKAFDCLLRLQSTYPKLSTTNQTFVRTTFTILTNFFLNRGEIDIARQYRVYEPQFGDQTYAQEKEVQILIREQRYHEALSSVLQLLDHSSSAPYLAQKRITYMMSLSTIYFHIKQPVVALNHVLYCLSLCTQYQLHSGYAEACLYLVEIYLALNQHQKALSLLQTIHSQIVLHCSLYLQAKMHFLKSKVITHSGKDYDQDDQIDNLENAISELENSYEKYDQIECLPEIIEICYLKSVIYANLYQLTSDSSYRQLRNKEAKLHVENVALLTLRKTSTLRSLDRSKQTILLASSLIATLTSC